MGNQSWATGWYGCWHDLYEFRFFRKHKIRYLSECSCCFFPYNIWKKDDDGILTFRWSVSLNNHVTVLVIYACHKVTHSLFLWCSLSETHTHTQLACRQPSPKGLAVMVWFVWPLSVLEFTVDHPIKDTSAADTHTTFRSTLSLILSFSVQPRGNWPPSLAIKDKNITILLERKKERALLG